MQLGPYVLLGEVGRGGMGVVYRARGPDGRDVALKLLLRPGAGDALARFDRERRLLAGLGEAEGFVPLLDVGTSPRGPYLVMPFVAGGTLRARLARGPLPPREAAALVQELARAAGRAHARGIVHRDLKAENVLFTAEGRPLITDLGLAKHFRHDLDGASQSVAVSKDGAMLGTLGSMAPEQVRDARSVGPPADVFALGTILHEALSGEPPFTGDHPAAIVSAMLAGDVPPLPADVPPWLAQVVKRCLHPQPAQRFADGEALALALKPPRARARRRAPLALKIALGLLLGAAATIAALSAGPPSAPDRVVPAPAPSTSEPPPTPSPPPPDPPTPTPTPPPEPQPTPARALPALVEGFRDGTALRLRAVWGSYAGRHEEGVISVDAQADGRRAVSCSEDKTVRLWSLPGLDDKGTIAMPSVPTCVALMQDGRQLAIGLTDGTVLVLQTDTARQVAMWKAGDVVTGIALSAGGSQALALDLTGHLRQWDLTGSAPIRDEVAHHGRGLDLAWPPGRGPLTVGEDGVLRAAHVSPGQPAVTQRFVGETLTCVSPGPGTLAAVGAASGAVTLVDVSTGERRWQVAGHRRGVNCVLVDAARGRVYSGGTDPALRAWDLATGAASAPLRLGGSVNDLALLPDGALLVGSADQTVRRLDPTLGSSRPEAPAIDGHATRVTQVIALDDATAITASADGTLRVWSIADGTTRRTFEEHGAWVADAAVRDGRVISGDLDGGVRVRDVTGDRPGVVLHVPETDATRVALLTGSRAVSLSTAGEGAVLLWDLDTRTSRPIRAGGQPTDFAVSPDEAVVAIGQADGTIVLCTTDDGAVLQAITPRGAPVTRMLFAPDGKTIISTDATGTLYVNLRVDEPALGETRRVQGHQDRGEALALSPDARRLITTSRDRQVALWDLASGAHIERLDLSSSGDHATCATWTPSGQTVLVGTARGVVLVFDVR